MASSALKPEEKNYWIFCMLNMQVAPTAVRVCFDTNIPPHDLANVINNNIQKIHHLVQRKILNNSQIDLLKRIPGVVWTPGTNPSGPTGITSRDFDVTLMVCLLRNLTNMTPPSSGWDNLPPNSDSSVGADLARIKYYRNKLAHTSEPSINQQEFSDQWQCVEQAINSLSGGTTNQQIQDILNMDIDGSNSKQKLRILEEELDDLKEGGLAQNMKAQIDEWLLRWKEDDKPFVETEATKTIWKELKENNFVVISGNSGSGKTATARHIALQLQMKMYQVIPVVNVEDILKYRRKKDKQVFVIDDVLGKYGVENRLLGILERHNEQIQILLEEKNIKLLCTLRKQVVNDKLFTSSETVLKKSVVNIDDISFIEKQSILKQHLEQNTRSLETHLVNKICATSVVFPLLCRLFTSNEERFNKKLEFFDKPYQILKEELERLKCRNKLAYCGLVLCMFSKNDLCDDFFSSTQNLHLIEDVMEECGLDRNTSRKSILDALESLVNVYVIRQNQTSYSFLHDSVFESIGYSFGMKSVECLLKYCDTTFILDRLRADVPEYETDETYVIVHKAKYRVLFERLAREIEIGNFIVLSSPIMHKEDFESSLCSYLYQDSNFRTKFNIINLTQEGNKKDLPVGKELMIWRLFYEKNVTLVHWFVAYGLNKLLECFWEHISLRTRKAYLGVGKRGMQLIHLAVLRGNIKTIQFLLKIGVNINGYDCDGRTPLLIAIKNDRFDIVSLLVRYDANVNMSNKRKSTFPLALSTQRENKEVLEFLIANNANINFVTHEANSAIFEAVRVRNTAIAKILLDNGADINLKTRFSSPFIRMPVCLHLAIYNMDEDMFYLLLEHESCDVNITDIQDNTPLCSALNVKHKQIRRLFVEKIVEKGPNLNHKNFYGESCFSVAFENDKDIFEYLLFEEVNKGTSLHLAVYHNNINMVKTEMSHSDINSTTPHGWSPLHIAALVNNFEAAEIMLNFSQCRESCFTESENEAFVYRCKDIDIDLLDKDGCSPIHLAYCSESWKMIELLIRHGVNLNIPFTLGIKIKRYKHTTRSRKSWNDRAGETLLYASVKENKTELAMMFLSNNADVAFIPHKQSSIVYEAMKNNNPILVEELLKYGADIRLGYFENPLQLAIENCQTDVVENICRFNDLKTNDARILKSACCTVSAKFWCTCCTKCCYNDVDKFDFTRATPLHSAVKSNNKEVVEILLRYDADPTILDNENKLAIDYAKHDSGIYERLKDLPRCSQKRRELTVLMLYLLLFIFVSTFFFFCGICIPVGIFETFYNSNFKVLFVNGTPYIHKVFSNSVNSSSIIELIRHSVPKYIFVNVIAFIYCILSALLLLLSVLRKNMCKIFYKQKNYFVIIISWSITCFAIITLYSVTVLVPSRNVDMVRLFFSIYYVCAICINLALFIYLFYTKLLRNCRSKFCSSDELEVQKVGLFVKCSLFFILIIVATSLSVLIIMTMTYIFACSSVTLCTEVNEDYYTAIYVLCNLCALYLFNQGFTEVILNKYTVYSLRQKAFKIVWVLCFMVLFLAFNIYSSVIRSFMRFGQITGFSFQEKHKSGFLNETPFQILTEVQYTDVASIIQTIVIIMDIIIYICLIILEFSVETFFTRINGTNIRICKRNNVLIFTVLTGIIIFLPFNIFFYFIKSYYASDAFESMFITFIILWNIFSFPFILYNVCCISLYWKAASKKKRFLKGIFVLFWLLLNATLIFLVTYFGNEPPMKIKQKKIFEDGLIYTYDVELSNSYKNITNEKGRLEHPMNMDIFSYPFLFAFLTLFANFGIVRSLNLIRWNKYYSVLCVTFNEKLFERTVAMYSCICMIVFIYFTFP